MRLKLNLVFKRKRGGREVIGFLCEFIWQAMCMFGTPDSNPDSVIQIQNHWVPHQKKMFGTWYLSEDWNPNLNFMWVPYQIWVHPLACFWMQSGFKIRTEFIGRCSSGWFSHRKMLRSHYRLCWRLKISSVQQSTSGTDYKVLRWGSYFPWRGIWNACVLPRVAFFVWWLWGRPWPWII